jgi:hypothetical protein
MKRIASLLCVLLAVAILPVALARADETLSNSSIIDLQKLGLSDAVIIQKIHASHCNFDTSTDGLKALKGAGVSDGVIAAMIGAGSASGESAPPVPPGDINDPLAPHDPGIWLYQEDNGQKTMTKIEPSIFGEVKSGVAWFYFYFEKTQSGLSDSSSSATSPDDFRLMKMEVKEKKDERSVVIGKVGLYGGGSKSGYDSKSIFETNYEKVSPGIFKVTPAGDLGGGEYCFVYAGTSATVGFGYAAGGPQKGFCFGIPGGSSKK